MEYSTMPTDRDLEAFLEKGEMVLAVDIRFITKLIWNQRL
jgi:hypothetical protein